MPGVLLDSNHVYDYYRRTAEVVSKIEALPTGAVILGCTVSLGEITAGHLMNRPPNPGGQRTRDEYVALLREKFEPSALEIKTATSATYAELIGRMWAKHRPGTRRNDTERHLFRQGNHKATLAHLVTNGVDINDVWCAAVAMEHGLTFVTTDGMAWIREAAGNDIRWDCWIANATASATASPPPP